MNSKINEKGVQQPGGDRPPGTVLRLVPRDEREQHETEPNAAPKTAAGRKIQRPLWDGDDDPGPSAA